MSIQTELTRITNAKAAIKTAIEGKGVTVPSGTLIDGMAALIEAIQAGGGGGISGYKVSHVQFTPAEDMTGWVTVPSLTRKVRPTNHGVLIAFPAYGQDYNPGNKYCLACGIVTSDGSNGGVYVNGGLKTQSFFTTRAFGDTYNSTQLGSEILCNLQSNYLSAGATYEFILLER